MEWLGFLIDLSVGEFSVPASKIEALKSRLREIKRLNVYQLGSWPV